MERWRDSERAESGAAGAGAILRIRVTRLIQVRCVLLAPPQ
jgi:hypothetical protein